MIKKNAYVAINPKTRYVSMVCLNDPKHAKTIADCIARGDVIERLPIDQARELFMEKAPKTIEI